jgi:putative ABC transport system permease protein
MIKNYFKTTLRYLWKNQAFSLINIIGLATGICVCFFALLYIHFELNHDTYNQKHLLASTMKVLRPRWDLQ